MQRSPTILFLLVMVASFFAMAQPQTDAPSSSSAPQKVPVMDGGAGPCSMELTVTDADAKPVYAATLKVHIAYGFAGIRRLDLEAGTNSDGKVKFTGLPARVHRAPLEFKASKDDLSGTASYDPSAECQAKRSITLAKSQAPRSSLINPRRHTTRANLIGGNNEASFSSAQFGSLRYLHLNINR
jgi:hypothetical protein